MKNLLPILRKLGKKMTGEDITGTNLVTVVDDIAEKYTGGSGGGDVVRTQLFSETVTTAEDEDGFYSAQPAYSQSIYADTITVTFDGTEYTCPRIDLLGQQFYGGVGEQGPVFTEYPFCIASDSSDTNLIYTETAGEHTVTVETLTASGGSSGHDFQVVEFEITLS